MIAILPSRASAAALAVFVAAAGCGKQDADGGSATNTVPGESTGGEGKAAAKPVPQAPARGPEHPVFSLVDNRLGGHVQRGGGLVVMAGSAGFAKYLRFGGKTPGWEMRRDAGGVKVATMRSKTANVHVPLTAEQAAASVIRVRAQ